MPGKNDTTNRTLRSVGSFLPRKVILLRGIINSVGGKFDESGKNRSIHRDASQRKRIYAERSSRQAGTERKDDLKMGVWKRIAGKMRGNNVNCQLT